MTRERRRHAHAEDVVEVVRDVGVIGVRRHGGVAVDEEHARVPRVHAVERALGIDNLYDQVSNNLVHQLQELRLVRRGTVLEKGEKPGW